MRLTPRRSDFRPMYTPFDTVAAVSTPYGKGGVAVIRLSGEDAVAMAARVFFPQSGRALADIPPRLAVYGEMRDPASGRVLDDGLCTVFRAPHSFTGEDTVELSCHGGVLVTRSVLEACLMAGARQALPGEYTRRAYLAGKLDLERAEALGNLLDAGNDEQLRLSRAGMTGLLTTKAEAVYSDLCGVLSNLEAGMDFPEEDLTELTREELIAATHAAAVALDALLDTYRTGHAIAEGLPTVICGRPNVGKSAFYNHLVGRDAAIVTDIAGTTRDILTDTVSLGRVTLRLSDTAGLRHSDDPVERIGVERARRALGEAELIFYLEDASAPATDTVTDPLLAELTGASGYLIRVRTKSDLLPSDASMSVPNDGIPTVTVSSVTGKGYDDLRAAVEAAFIDADLRMGEEAVVFSARQAAAIRESVAALRTTEDSLTIGLPYDLCASDLRSALASLAALAGHDMTEDVITEIFSRFCVGK